MKKLFSIALIATIFLLAFAFVQPITHSLDFAQSANQFHEDHIEPTMDIEIGYFDPFVKSPTPQTASFKIRFAALTPIKAETQTTETGHGVNEFVAQTPNNYLIESDQITQVEQAEHWYDGSVTTKPVSTDGLNQQQTGDRYEGWFPSPDQAAELIAWSNSWTLTSIVSCERSYETEAGREIVDAVYEQEIPAITTNTSFELMASGELTVSQSPSLLKAMGYDVPLYSDLDTKVINPFTLKENQETDVTTNLEIERTDLDTKFVGCIIALACLIVGWFIIDEICRTMIATDATPYGIDDLADKYEEGFNLGVNESHDNYRDRLKDRLIAGDISNESYILLTNELDDNYDQTIAEFVNPYEGLSSGGENSWWHTVITVITIIIIVTVIIIVLLVALYFIRKTSWGKRKREEGGILGWFLGLGSGKKKA